MKLKMVAIILLFGTSLFFLFHSPEKEQGKKIEETAQEEVRGVFLSYIELKKYIYNLEEKKSKENIQKIIQTIKDNHFNLLILQVRSFSDAIYPSRIFPSSKVVVEKEGDPLEYDYLDYFIKKHTKSTLKYMHGLIHTE